MSGCRGLYRLSVLAPAAAVHSVDAAGCRSLAELHLSAASLARLDLTNCAALSAPLDVGGTPLGRVLAGGCTFTAAELRAAV